MPYRESEVHLTDLTEAERAAFGALVQRMVHVDQRISFQESDVLADLARTHGIAFWESLEAATKLDEDASTAGLAESIGRPEIQQFTYEVLRQIAACDAVQPSEASLLTELRNRWNI